MIRTAAAALLLLLVSCASTTSDAPFAAPQWDALPPPILDALCARLRIDAIATGAPLTISRTTRALATPQLLAQAAFGTRGAAKADAVAAALAEANRALPVTTEGATCPWRTVPAEQLASLRDEMVVELSAPVSNPFARRQAGVLARVTVAGEHPSWYWIALAGQGERWAVTGVSVLMQ